MNDFCKIILLLKVYQPVGPTIDEVVKLLTCNVIYTLNGFLITQSFSLVLNH